MRKKSAAARYLIFIGDFENMRQPGFSDENPRCAFSLHTTPAHDHSDGWQ